MFLKVSIPKVLQFLQSELNLMEMEGVWGGHTYDVPLIYM